MDGGKMWTRCCMGGFSLLASFEFLGVSKRLCSSSHIQMPKYPHPSLGLLCLSFFFPIESNYVKGALFQFVRYCSGPANFMSSSRFLLRQDCLNMDQNNRCKKVRLHCIVNHAPCVNQSLQCHTGQKFFNSS